MVDVLSRNILKEAERVIKHVEELEAMFPSNEAAEEGARNAEAIAEVLPILDGYVDGTNLVDPSPKAERISDRRVRFAFCRGVRR